MEIGDCIISHQMDDLHEVYELEEEYNSNLKLCNMF